MSDVFQKKFKRVKRKRRIFKKGGLNRVQMKQVKGLVNQNIDKRVENKVHDVPFSALSISFVPTITDVSALLQGTNYNNRIGIKAEITSIQFNLRFLLGDATNYVRVVLFQWLAERSAAAPTWIDIMQYGTAGGLPANQYELMSPYTLANGTESLFRILYNEEINLDADNSIQQVKGYINKGFRKMIDFDNTTANSGTGHIYLMVVSDSAAIAHPTFDGITRLRFRDA